ncbi:MAG: tyrosine recombinase XerC [Pseudomonadota bacterium]
MTQKKKAPGAGTAKTRTAKRAKSAPLPPAPPFDADIVQHLRHLQGDRRLAPRTLAMYSEAFQRLMRFLAAAEPGLPLRQVRPHHVRQWVGELHMGGLAPRSIAMILSAWRGLYRWLGRDDLVDANPVDGVRAPKAPKPLPKALSVEQAVALAAHQEDDADSAQQAALHARDHFITELLYGCGLRLGELVGLDCVASPQAAGWVDVPDATAHVLGKGSKRRTVPVGSPALKALAVWLAHRPQLADPLEPALLVSNRGTRLTAGQVRLRLKRQARLASLPTHVHPHMLRHSFASHVLQSSGDLRAVQELLGHAHIATTQVYTKLDFGHLSKVYDAAHPRAKKKPGP